MTESTHTGCDIFHPTAMSAWIVFLDSPVRSHCLGHWHLTISKVPPVLALAPMHQAPLQLCLHFRTWEEGWLHLRGGNLLPLALCMTHETSLWSLTLCGLTTLLVSSLSVLVDFRFRSLIIRLPSLAENNVIGLAPSLTNHGISHISKEVSARLPEHLPCGGRGWPHCPGTEKTKY